MVDQAPPFPPAGVELYGQFQVLPTLQGNLPNLPSNRGLTGLQPAVSAQAGLISIDKVWQFAAGCGFWGRFGQALGIGAFLWFAAQPARWRR